MHEDSVVVGVWDAPYVGDQDKRQGFTLAQFRFALNMTKGDSKAIPLGLAIECRVADGYVLAGLSRTSLSGGDLKDAHMETWPELLHAPQVLLRRRLEDVQMKTVPHRPYRGPYLARAYNQFDGYLMSSFGARQMKEFPSSLIKEYGFRTSATRLETLRKIPLLLTALSHDPYLWSGLVLAFV